MEDHFRCSIFTMMWAMAGDLKFYWSLTYHLMFIISFKWVPLFIHSKFLYNINISLQNPVRWNTPKAPTFKINEQVPPLLDEILKYLLPLGLSVEQREMERQSIHRFIKELNQIRRNHIDRDFSNSYIVNNISALGESYPFVSIHF